MPVQNQQNEAPALDDAEEPLRRLRDVICALHHQLLEIIQSPPPVADSDALSVIQHEAGRLLVMGLELFYPTQALQCQLLSELVSCGSGMDSPIHGASRCAQKLGLVSTGKLAAQEVLLKPLLERLVDDNLASALVPPPPLPSSREPQEAQAGRMVVSMLHLLIQRLLQLHFADCDADAALGSAGFAMGPVCEQQGRSPAGGSHAQGPQGACHVQQNAGLIVQFVLTVQKHLMNWAAEEACAREQAGAEEGQGQLPPQAQGQSRGRQLLEEAVQRGGKHASAPGWECLLEYVQSALRQSMEALTQLPGLVEERRMRAPTAAQAPSMSSQDLVLIEQSFIGTVLPSLITGLLPFAYQPYFAFHLTPLIGDFHALLNRVAAALPEIAALDTLFVRQRGGDPFVVADDGLGGMLSSTSPASTAMQASMRARKRGSGAGQAGGLGVDALKLPPLYCLLKSLGFLASRFAGTLTVGEGDFRQHMAALRAQPQCARWVSSGLLSGGLEPSCSELFGRPVVVTPTQRRPGAPAKNSRGAAVQAQSGAQAGPCDLPTAAQLEVFLDSHPTPGYRELAAVLRKEHAARDHAYAMLRRQAELSPDAAAVEAMENAVCAAVLKHSGLALEACVRCARSREELKVPPRGRLGQVWKPVAEVSVRSAKSRLLIACHDSETVALAQVFTWVWRRRSELRSQGKGLEACISGMLQAIRDGASVLLLFMPAGASVQSILQVPYVGALPLPPVQGTRPAPAAKLRRAILTVRTMVRWRRACSVSGVGVGGEVIRFLRSLAEGARGELPAGANAQALRLDTCLAVVVDNHRKALVRDLGLRSFRSLLSSTRVQSVACEVMHALGPSLRDPSSTAGQYLTGLDAVGERLHRQVQRSFESLYEDICQRMTEMLAQGRGVSVGGDGGASQPSSLEAGQLATSTWDTHLLLMLIDAWGLKFKERDWGFLVSVGIAQLLQRVMRELQGSLGGPEEHAHGEELEKRSAGR
jgi:hypothetical protein